MSFTMFNIKSFSNYVYFWSISVKNLKQQSNGQTASSYLGAYGTSFNTAQSSQYPYGQYASIFIS